MSKHFDPSAWISQAEAARIRGVSRQSISELVERGRLTTFVIAGKTLVSRSQIEQFHPRKPGPKTKPLQSKKRR
jgi:hypothetical protein